MTVISTKDLVKTELAADVIEEEDCVYVLTHVPYNKDEIEVTFKKHGDTGELIIEACGCAVCDLICCGVPMKEVKAKAKK